MKTILSSLEGVELREKHGGRFRFPIYMTDAMHRTGIESLDLGVRAYHSLKRAGIDTIGELAEGIADGVDLKSLRNCGEKSIREIMVHLFLYQYNSLKPERQERYLLHVVDMNRRKSNGT